MNAPRCDDEEYIQSLIAAPRVVSATEAARVQPRHPDARAHDAFTRLLHRLEPDPATLWHEVEGQVERARGVLVLDDSTLDKPYVHKMELVLPEVVAARQGAPGRDHGRDDRYYSSLVPLRYCPVKSCGMEPQVESC